MKGIVHGGESPNGEKWEVEVTRGVSFRAYEVRWSDKLEVTVEEGVITHRLPDELDAQDARAFAALLMEAADELERGA